MNERWTQALWLWIAIVLSMPGFADDLDNRMARLAPHACGVALATVEFGGGRERRRDIVNRQTLNVEPIVVEPWLGQWCPISSRSMSTG
ncbi:hypothetical protein Rcae01_04577 [Novipirellula caenicola]|uniref:Uncharacterized protein n=1 Tax=Novipirellula caenicola TaxID=1536901 RepID=A0ABP9VZS7_9BACT